MAQHKDPILILDFGAQYTQLISRKVRELGVYSEIKPFNISIQEIKKLQPKGLILSGGPESVYEKNAPLPDKSISLPRATILVLNFSSRPRRFLSWKPKSINWSTPLIDIFFWIIVVESLILFPA